MVDDNGYAQINQGKIQGNVESDPDHIVFYGIPYAAPPVGDNRWKAAGNAQPWSGTRHVEKFSDVAGCPQDSSHPTAPAKISEDCLFLNIYMPKPSDINQNSRLPNRRPVMLWIHGGSWMHGYGSMPLYNGRHLVRESGAIVVTINYRLGSMGFLYDQDHSSEVSGNQAVNDMLAAIRWVRANIDLFYGDPDQITIYGESAGGQSVATLLTLKNSADRALYNQAIVQSSPFGIPYRTKSQATEEAEELLKQLGCSDWSCAKSKSMSEVLAAQDKVRGIIDRDLLSSAFEAWTPVLDNKLVDMHPFDALKSGRAAEKNAIFGHTTGEGSVFVYGVFKNKMGKTAYELAVNTLFGSDSAAVLKEFPSTCRTIDRNCDMRPTLSLIAGSYLFDCPLRNALQNRANDHSAQSGNTFYYLFDHPVTEFGGIPPAAVEPCSKVSCHGAELFYMFGTFDDMNLSPTKEEKALSAKLMGYWTNFAFDGNPNVRGEKANCWDVYSSRSEDTCERGAQNNPYEILHMTTGTFSGVTEPAKVKLRCDFWDNLDAYLQH